MVFERTQPAVASAPPQSFADFFEAESRRLGRAIYLLTGDAQKAEDLVQEAMVRAFERWERVRAMAHPSGYVFTIASNLYRRRRKHRRRTQRLHDEAPGPVGHDDPAETKVRIIEALDTLTHEQREALLLVEWYGLTSEEAGQVLGIDAASIRSRVRRAREALQRRMGGNHE